MLHHICLQRQHYWHIIGSYLVNSRTNGLGCRSSLDHYENKRKRRPRIALIVGVGLELGRILAIIRRAPVVFDEHATEPGAVSSNIEQFPIRAHVHPVPLIGVVVATQGFSSTLPTNDTVRAAADPHLNYSPHTLVERLGVLH